VSGGNEISDISYLIVVLKSHHDTVPPQRRVIQLAVGFVSGDGVPLSRVHSNYPVGLPRTLATCLLSRNLAAILGWRMGFPGKAKEDGG
jgi:hypothetical protein